MTTQKYREASRHLLTQGRAELASGDTLQASEKGWGAAAQMLKAIAEERGWEHGKHRHLSRVASRLWAETGDRDVLRWFQVAEALHGNFYEDQMEPTDIGDSLDDVERLLDKLEPSRAGRVPKSAAQALPSKWSLCRGQGQAKRMLI